jgi:hypothetical protein
MIFEDIAFYQQSGSKENSEYGLHLKGYWVQKIFFEEAWMQAQLNIPKLKWDKPQTVVAICGDKNWKSRKVGVRIRIGRCLKYFVGEGMLPLCIANPNKKGSRKYSRN